MQAGFSILEMSVAVSVVAFGALGALSLTLSSMRLDEGNRQTVAAISAVRQVVETVETVPFEEVFARFNSNPADDPFGAGSAEGGEFHFVYGDNDNVLPSIDPDLTVGTVFTVNITFPTNAKGELVEGATPLAPGLSTDLDNDGRVIRGTNVRNSYRVLPVRAEVHWQGQVERQRAVFHRLLTAEAAQRESTVTGEADEDDFEGKSLKWLTYWAELLAKKLAASGDAAIARDLCRAIENAAKAAEQRDIAKTKQALVTAQAVLLKIAAARPGVADALARLSTRLRQFWEFYRDALPTT